MKLTIFFIIILFSHLCMAQVNLCSDTSKRERLYISQDSSILIKKIFTLTPDINILSASVSKVGETTAYSTIIKTNGTFNVGWAKLFPGNQVNGPAIFIDDCIVTADNKIVVLAGRSGIFNQTENFILVFDINGILINSIRALTMNVPNRNVFERRIYLIDNNTIVLKLIYNEALIVGQPHNWFSINKINLTTGNTEWSKAYSTQNNFYTGGGIISGRSFIIHNLLWLKFAVPPQPNLIYGQNLMKFDLNNGNLISEKTYFYQPPNPLPADYGSVLVLSYFNGFQKLNNTNLKFFTGSLAYRDRLINISEFDTSLSVKKSTHLSLTGNTSFNYLQMQVAKNGESIITGAASTTSNEGSLVVLDSNNNITLQKKITYTGLPDVNFFFRKRTACTG